jgi:uncharacterized protein (DUF305 family)
MNHLKCFLVVLVVSASVACKSSGADNRPQAATPPPSSTPTLVQPGAPGQATKAIDAAQATDLSKVQYTQADVKFMQGMIGHHSQAVEMVALLKQNTKWDDMRKLGLRIEVSQEDEIKMMQTWLKNRGQALPDPHAHHMPGGMMPGMLTMDEMARLGTAKGPEFDRLFLEGMIKHHGGAITMVEELFATPGAGQDGDIYAFASDVVADQKMEIDRMGAMLATVKERLQ